MRVWYLNKTLPLILLIERVVGFVIDRSSLLHRQKTISLGTKTNKSPFDEFSRRDFIFSSTLITALTQAGLSESSQVRAASIIEERIYDAVPPFSTRRKYKDLVLKNGMRVLLVSDKKAFRETAALSVLGAGQFQEDSDLGGLAHLMEHMVSSASVGRDFEDWLSDRDGASNAFTAPSLVCYHFNTPTDVFQESLLRFSQLFQQDAVEKACQNDSILRREIRRVNEELSFDDESVQAFYLIKSIVNQDHPFSRFTQGSKDSLETSPSSRGINVKTRLTNFYETRYLAERSVLVVVSRSDISTLEKWVEPFAITMSRSFETPVPVVDEYPPILHPKFRAPQYVLFRPKPDTQQASNANEKISFTWLMDRKYNSDRVIAATTVGFFVSQVIDRRGPGSLYLYLVNRGWVPQSNQGLPKVSFPIDISGFQMMKLEFALTRNGFNCRSAVIDAVYRCLNEVTKVTTMPGSFVLPSTLLKQYATTAQIYGYVLAPRPPDGVELAIDAHRYGIGGTSGIGDTGVWHLLPPLEEPGVMASLSNAVAEVLTTMNDRNQAIIVTTASSKSISESKNSLIENLLPPVASLQWKIEAVSGAKYILDDRRPLTGKLEEFMTQSPEDEGILPPLSNPLIPSVLRPGRVMREVKDEDGSRRMYYIDKQRDGEMWREFVTKTPSTSSEDVVGLWQERALSLYLGPKWQLYQTSNFDTGGPKLPMPIMPTEATCRATLVIQLLSARPARAKLDQAVHAQLWLASLENAVSALAELGAPAGLTYDMSFNKYGLRVCFMGISQNIAAYAKRFCSRMVVHHNKLHIETEFGPTVLENAISDANRQRSTSLFRKRQTVSVLKNTSPRQAAMEGEAFLASCSGGMVLAQGDFLPKEAICLLKDLKQMLDPVIDINGSSGQPSVPKLSEILYKPFWKPRSSSMCLIPGLPLISDPCGRIPR